jgi:hypothetical protein
MVFPPRYIFRGNAFGIGGQVREPFMPYFEVQAASSLPTVGGLSRAEARGRDFSNLLSFGLARTKATGGVRRERDPKNNTSVVESEVFDVLVERRFFAERTAMSLRSYPQHGDEQLHVVPEVDTRDRDTTSQRAATAIDGVNIDGCRVEVILELQPFIDAPTKRDVKEKFRGDPRWKEFRGQFFRPDDRKALGHEVFESKGLIFATIVKEIIVHHDGTCGKHGGELVVKDNTIKVPNFGTVFFGELIIDDTYRRLTGIRLELGSPAEASLEVAGVDSNGGGAP